MKRTRKTLSANGFPQDMGVLLSGFEAGTQIGKIPINFAWALARCRSRHLLGSLIADDCRTSQAEYLGNFTLCLALRGQGLDALIQDAALLSALFFCGSLPLRTARGAG